MKPKMVGRGLGELGAGLPKGWLDRPGREGRSQKRSEAAAVRQGIIRRE